MSKKPKPFSHILVDHIWENYQGKAFTSISLEEFGKKYNKNRPAISQILYEMKKREKIEIVGEIPKTQGGTSVKIYQIVEGADFTDLKVANMAIEWRNTQALREKKQAEACLRLCKALDSMISRNHH